MAIIQRYFFGMLELMHVFLRYVARFKRFCKCVALTKSLKNTILVCTFQLLGIPRVLKFSFCSILSIFESKTTMLIINMRYLDNVRNYALFEFFEACQLRAR